MSFEGVTKAKTAVGAGAESVPVSMRRAMLEKLMLVREFELTCERWWNAGEPLIGEFHLSLGQEAFAVGACMAAEPEDPICPSIRGMGVYLCRGVSMVPLIASFFEREGGISEGRWAHWHSPATERNILPQTGMLGSGLVTAVGVAMAQKLRASGRVVLGMLGDGTTNTGYFHEGVNLAAVKQLPIVIVIENNQYAISTPITSTTRVRDLSQRAAGYGIPGVTVDGTDVVAVYLAIRDAIKRARDGDGPTLVELKAYRWGGQTLKDPDRTRPSEEKAAARQRCPIERLKQQMVTNAELKESDFAAIDAQVRASIKQAETHARGLAPIAPPAESDMLRVLNPYAE